jgi:hypothetical protein
VVSPPQWVVHIPDPEADRFIVQAQDREEVATGAELTRLARRFDILRDGLRAKRDRARKDEAKAARQLEECRGET